MYSQQLIIRGSINQVESNRLFPILIPNHNQLLKKLVVMKDKRKITEELTAMYIQLRESFDDEGAGAQ